MIQLLGCLAVVPWRLELFIPKDSGGFIYTLKIFICNSLCSIKVKDVSGVWQSYLHILVNHGIDVLFRKASCVSLLLLENQHQRYEHYISIEMSLLFKSNKYAYTYNLLERYNCVCVCVSLHTYTYIYVYSLILKDCLLRVLIVGYHIIITTT